MAAPLDDDIESNNQDFYSLLNVRKEATAEELKASYRRLCMLYHPDKHRDPELKRQAEQLFNQVHQAYEVLSDAHSRAIYDIFGKKGLEVEGWEVVERKRTPAEIREEYERLQREREERRLQQRTNPKGTISVGVDATDLFDRYDEDFEEMPGGGFPHIEINKMHISQSIEAPLTNSDTAVLSGSLSTHNGNGGGNINMTVRRVMSAKGWGEVEFGAGDILGPLIGLKVFRNVTPRCFMTAQCGLQFSPRGLRPSCSLMTARHLDQNTMGYLQWRWGPNSAMTTSLVRDTKSSHFTLALQLGVPHSYLMMSYQYKFQDEDQTKVKGSVKTGWFGTVVEYGAERKISRHSILSATVSIGVPQGVTLKIKLARANQTYLFPVHLTDQLLPSAVFYATVGPLLVYMAVHRLIVIPYTQAQKEQELELQRKSSATDIAKKKQEAESAVLLMQESVRRIIEAEESKMGLIILNAWYGTFVSDTSQKQEKAKVIDVTVPLQCLVKDSKLILTEASKSGLPGFYDPCVGEEKSLKLLYQFRGVLHQVISADTESLRIPKQSHRIESES
ncbi:dnaJ homolog subfamily C member 11 [Pundamilia nyererei]|uniref:DnaJ homolog subfamily C member 11 n=3 Tax=Haplochromini TaxID=319058 RepID=A0A9Y3R5V6_9CICH|nr:dnaJ homolog subfamily C member 11 [Maylandia zebra]XP_005731410.1 PREDICTED: dnaJ homolog subfamily C member 11 [Pundamilia nyererei]XP_026024198.1 dnaJ homolog subfamily C member 11 isoform X1 [Astatotilapia calliptera]XP_039884917.1 dnaJ homolog subfamily C member 11-like [Simochromis diagramma]